MAPVSRRSPASRPKPTARSFRPTASICWSPATSIPSASAGIRRRLQPEAPRSGEATARSRRVYHRAALSPLDHVEGKPAQPSAFHFARRRQGGRSLTRARAMCRRFRSAVPTITPSRPTARKSASPMNADHVPATSTNTDLFVVPIAGGTAHKITANPGADNSPLYSPDGKYLAWRVAGIAAGYESDRWRLLVLERATGKLTIPHRCHRPLGQQLHLVARFEASVLHVDDRGRQAIQFVAVEGGGARIAVSGRQHARRHAVHAPTARRSSTRSRAASRRSRSIAKRRRAAARPSRSRISTTSC